MVASHQFPEVLWAFARASDGPRLLAIGHDGVTIGEMALAVPIDEIKNISAGVGDDGSHYLYLLGHSETETGGTLSLLRLPEPDPSGGLSPGIQRFDIELPSSRGEVAALLVDPDTKDPLVFTSTATASSLYRVSSDQNPGRALVADLVARTSIPLKPVVDADISTDGSIIALRTPTDLWLWERESGESITEAISGEPCTTPTSGETIGAMVSTSPEVFALNPGVNDQFSRFTMPISLEDPQTVVNGASAVNTAPTLMISSPEPDFEWSRGEPIVIEALVEDDQAVFGGDIKWNIQEIFCPKDGLCQVTDHKTIEGNPASVRASNHGPASEVSIEVSALYIDPGGLSDRASVVLRPSTSKIIVTTEPPGVVVEFDRDSRATPFELDAIRGSIVQFSVPALQVVDGRVIEGVPDGSANYEVHGDSAIDIQLPLEFQPTPVAGSSVRFGGDDRVSVGNVHGLSSDLTYELWLRPSDRGERQNPLAKAVSGEGTITQEPNGVLNFFHGSGGDSGTPYERFVSGTALSLDRWHHVVITRSGTTLRWYVDGLLTNTGTSTLFPSSSDLPLQIGDGYTNGFSGWIDEVAVYGRALSAAEVSSHYEAINDPTAYGTSVISDEPIAFWRLDEIAGTIAVDQMGNWHGAYLGTPDFGQPGAR